MKINLKALTLVLALILSLGMLAGCNSNSSDSDDNNSAKALPAETPAAIVEVRDQAMTNIQSFVTNNEGSFADSLETLINSESNTDISQSATYTSLQSKLISAKQTYSAENIYVIIRNEDGKYQKTVTTEEKAEWLSSVELSEYIIENIEAGLITSSKCGHDNLWTVYAPLLNSSGNQVAVAVMEVPIDLTDYPEWDKNSESWHGIE